jgi:hypothetical protein
MLKTTSDSQNKDSKSKDSQKSFEAVWSWTARKLRIPHLKGVTGRPASPCQLKQPLWTLSFRLLALIAFIAIWQLKPVFADTVPVRQTDGPVHGFLLVKTLDGKTIGEGDLTETVKAATVRMQTILRFYDGSYYEETSEFSQRGQFRLLRNHLIQKGPSFKQVMERSIDASTGQVIVRYTDDKGQGKEETQRFDLPPDISNGMFFTLIKNIDPAKTETTVTIVAGAPKQRLVKVTITPEGKAPFLIGRSKREGIAFDLKPKIEGAAGVIAPLVGKQPADTHIWILAGNTPVALKSEGSLEPEGPIWRIESTSPVWPSDTAQK